MFLYCQVTYYRVRSSLRKTEHRTFRCPWRQSSGQPMRLCQGYPRQIPDRPSQRTQTAFVSGKKKTDYHSINCENYTSLCNTTQWKHMCISKTCTWYHHNFSYLLPLLLCGVGSSGIMGTSMQNKDGALWTALQGKTEMQTPNQCNSCESKFSNIKMLTSKSLRKPDKSRPLFSASQYLYGRTSSKPALLNTALWFSETNSNNRCYATS